MHQTDVHCAVLYPVKSPAMRLLPALLIMLLPNFLYSQKNQTAQPDVQSINNINYFNVSSLNSPAIDFSPTYYKNGLVYVSSRRKNGPIDRKIGETFFELFFAELNTDHLPLKPAPFSLQLNSRLHEGPLCFSRDGQQVFFTRNNLRDGITIAGEQGKVGLKIFTAERQEYDWGNISELPFNNNDFNCMHPSLSPDGMRLFLASNKPGGFGGYDLYVVEKRGGAWSDMINLGPEINTPGNEVFPFIHETGMLFFTSDGHPGMGGLDIFSIDLSVRVWSKVNNLGEPFNSTDDDLALILHPSGKHGFFSSNRPGGAGKDDLYGFKIPDGLNNIAAIPPSTLKVTVYDGLRNKRMPSATLHLFERRKDGLSNDNTLYLIELFPLSGNNQEFSFRMMPKYQQVSDSPSALCNQQGEAQLDIQNGKDYILQVMSSGFKTKELIILNQSPGNLKPLDVVLEPENCKPQTILISSQYNTRIPGATVRIRNIANGEITTTRTAINGAFQFCFDSNTNYTITAEKEGFITQDFALSTDMLLQQKPYAENLRITLQATSPDRVRTPFPKGSLIILQNIQYETGNPAIQSERSREMEALLTFLHMFPSVHIELTAHTDSRGPTDINLITTAKRADAAKGFLVNNGIDPSRIRASGFGESRLKNGCKDGVPCSEAEHLQNRRIEIRILHIDEVISNH
jgi:outer membrane protein OmpA-like peptidoglycan-associated protein